MSVTIWFNPACSKCRAVQKLLEERGVKIVLRYYLEQPPSVAELETLVAQLEDLQAVQLLRSKEKEYEDRFLADVSPAERIAAAHEIPALINRPIVVVGNRAIVARPPRLALELL